MEYIYIYTNGDNGDNLYLSPRLYLLTTTTTITTIYYYDDDETLVTFKRGTVLRKVSSYKDSLSLPCDTVQELSFTLEKYGYGSSCGEESRMSSESSQSLLKELASSVIHIFITPRIYY